MGSEGIKAREPCRHIDRKKTKLDFERSEEEKEKEERQKKEEERAAFLMDKAKQDQVDEKAPFEDLVDS